MKKHLILNIMKDLHINRFLDMQASFKSFKKVDEQMEEGGCAPMVKQDSHWWKNEEKQPLVKGNI